MLHHEIRWNSSKRILERMLAILPGMMVTLAIMRRFAGRRIRLPYDGRAAFVTLPRNRENVITELWEMALEKLQPAFMESVLEVLKTVEGTYMELQTRPDQDRTAVGAKRPSPDGRDRRVIAPGVQPYFTVFKKLRRKLQHLLTRTDPATGESGASPVDPLVISLIDQLERRRAALSEETVSIVHRTYALSGENIPSVGALTLASNHTPIDAAREAYGRMTTLVDQICCRLEDVAVEDIMQAWQQAVARIAAVQTVQAPAEDAEAVVMPATFGDQFSDDEMDEPVHVAAAESGVNATITREVEIVGQALAAHGPLLLDEYDVETLTKWLAGHAALSKLQPAASALASQHPALRSVVASYLCVVGTSVEDERTFSQIRANQGLYRDSMEIDMLCASMRCKANQDLIDSGCVTAVNLAQQRNGNSNAAGVANSD